MVKVFKISIYFIMSLVFYGIFSTSAHADTVSNELITPDVNVTLTNDLTGEVQNIEPLKINNTNNSFLLKNSESPINLGYEIFIPIVNSKENEISTRESTGGTQTSRGVKARLSVDFDTSGNNEKVRLNNISGGWSPTSNIYTITTRKVDAHSGITGNTKKISKKPSSNSFSYKTGWGYNLRVGGHASPRAWSSAKIKVNGMSATHTIKIEFTYGT